MGDELARIAALRAIYGDPGEGIALGIGDDAAVTREGAVWSVDAAIEGVHFRRAWIGRGARWEDVGYRAAVAALSDLAAMGARPRAMLSAIALPASEDDEVLLAIARGTAEAARAHGAPVIGGNLARAGEISITTTVIGALPEGASPLTRAGGRAGDAIWVSGACGAAALGIAALEAGRGGEESAAWAVRRFLAPSPRFEVAARALGIARAAIDVSDGLAHDLAQLCEASGVGAELDLAALPIDDAMRALAASLGVDAVELALGGGDDYELVLALPADASIEGATRVGTLTASRALRARDPSGALRALDPRGFDHFRP